ncbi:hypothetical protein Nepgr_007517 [Nepenthes gracilis]|uniref:Uncharacterized protein n=1 Tax=Nepenthes gracilis TaxID=150966 RepID=A0AAD3S714_NEPGR|nr:hypothetical protein Nepgr_007517 [Nepenthes gracilis]
MKRQHSLLFDAVDGVTSTALTSFLLLILMAGESAKTATATAKAIIPMSASASTSAINTLLLFDDLEFNKLFGQIELDMKTSYPWRRLLHSSSLAVGLLASWLATGLSSMAGAMSGWQSFLTDLLLIFVLYNA